MDVHEDDQLIIRENPFDSDHYDVIWKPRKTFAAKEYRSRQKPSTVENKLKSYNDKTSNDIKNNKDKAINYTYIDEYCRVSGPGKTRNEESRPATLKTTTGEFGRPKVSFDTFVRHHIGGGGTERTEYTTAQPLTKETRECQRAQGNTFYRCSGNRETTPLRDCYEQDEITLKCCGHNVETLVDYCTCMFCVKGIFYHCAEDSSRSDRVLDNPCSCSPVNTGCFARWSLLGLLSVFLPCLMCYPVARGCTGVCKCYKEGESRRKNRHNLQNREIPT
ncbi:sprouty-related, EVH1 domain-containing protein 2-like [Dendronephthya gigantea]|uniref:sprouty-related, EVH1 domain-containing protein 2-like n=1 Tax=Dendronephthya gigantea TaxID=151771 RepID=UPI00106AB4AA|nr:sprouty-related, EVH1 domain-containing protein 2-like [Dendronephthya gigantea]